MALNEILSTLESSLSEWNESRQLCQAFQLASQTDRLLLQIRLDGQREARFGERIAPLLRRIDAFGLATPSFLELKKIFLNSDSVVGLSNTDESGVSDLEVDAHFKTVRERHGRALHRSPAMAKALGLLAHRSKISVTEFWTLVFNDFAPEPEIDRARVHNLIARLRPLHAELQKIGFRGDFIEWAPQAVKIRAPELSLQRAQLMNVQASVAKMSARARRRRSFIESLDEKFVFQRKDFQQMMACSKATAQRELNYLVEKKKITRILDGQQTAYQKSACLKKAAGPNVGSMLANECSNA